MQTALIVAFCIVFSATLWRQAKQADRQERVTRTRKFFDNVVSVAKKTSFWGRYLQQLQVEINRLGFNIPVMKYARYLPLAVLAFVGVTYFVFHVSLLLTITMTVLLLMLPRKLLAEVSSRRVIKIRKRLVLDVITPGIQTLRSGDLNDVCHEIENDPDTSELIRREFKYINDLGHAPGDMDVARAMVIRAKELGISEFVTLALVTMEGQRYNSRLTDVWTDIQQALSDRIKIQAEIATELSAYRWAAIGLFLALVLFIIFGYHLLHIHGLMQFGMFITLVAYFYGISAVVKTTQAD